MDDLSGSLGRILGQARFGVYALPQGRRPILLTASRGWPASFAGCEAILDAARSLPSGDLRRASSDTIILPVREESGALAALVVRAGPRDGVWKLAERDWDQIAKHVRAALHPAASRPAPARGTGALERRAPVGAGRRAPDTGRRATNTDRRAADTGRRATDARPRPGDAGRHAGGDMDSLRAFHDALLSGLPLGVLRIDSRGRATYMSTLAEEILGIPPGEGIGADCRPHFESPGLEENPLDLAIQGKISTFEIYLTDREGHDRAAWVQASPIPGGPDSAVPGPGTRKHETLILLRDTSDERAFEEEMRRRERLASIGELSAGVAHEIRNPLTGIGNCAQVLRDRIPPDDPRMRFVQIILDESARLNRIVDSLLSFARPPRPQLREADAVDVVRRTIELEEERLAKDAIACDFKVRGRIPQIYIDPEQILQVLLNVIRNAADSMPEGGRIHIECSVVRRRPHLRRGVGQRRTDRFRRAGDPPPAAYVQIRISDTGRGIPPDALPRIFDPFFTTRPKGTGLGLSISQSIIIEHGGFISVRSVEGRGTTVSVDLPVERRRGERRKGIS